MKYRKQIKEAARLAEVCRVTKGEHFRLKDHDPGDTGDVKDQQHSQEIIDDRAGLITNLQEKLYAQDRYAILIVLQAADAAGKDGTIKHVMSGVNPQGCDVHSFKRPSAEELSHDYLWRCALRLPERGKITIFNRSYYEEVLVARVHPEILDEQKIPREWKDKKIWNRRFEEINGFEKYLFENGIIVLKFFLNLSRREQKRRFLERIDRPEKNWKFSTSDAEERKF